MRLTVRMILAATVVARLAGTASAQTYTAVIDGLQEVPPVATPASGTGTFTLDAAKILSYNIAFSGLIGSETGAHIHGPAPAGVPAGVLFPLPAGSPKIGTIGPLSPAQEADLNAGLWYVNIHTTFRPGGEIRGQILRDLVGVEGSTWSGVKSLFQ